jgi:hypothetical protein
VSYEYHDVYRQYESTVPMIPPRLRPERLTEQHVIIWEANWKKKPIVDPILAKIIKWPLCELIMGWDLTEAEAGIYSL